MFAFAILYSTGVRRGTENDEVVLSSGQILSLTTKNDLLLKNTDKLVTRFRS